MKRETAWEKVARLSKEGHIPSHEQETGEIDPQVEMELRRDGFTDEYFRQRKAGILEVNEMKKHPMSYEEMEEQMLRHNKRY